LIGVAKVPGVKAHERCVRDEWLQYCHRKIIGEVNESFESFSVLELDRVLSSGGASFFEWGGQRRANTFLGGKSIWLPITHFHYTGHILHYSKFPSLSLELSFLFASYGSLPFNLSFIPISRPSPPLIQLGAWGSTKLPQRVRAEPGRQMEFGEFWAEVQ